MTWHWWRYQQPIASRLSGFFQRCDHQKLLWCHRQLHSAKKDWNSVRVQYSKALVENCQICPLLKIPPFFGSWDFFAFVVILPVKKRTKWEDTCKNTTTEFFENVIFIAAMMGHWILKSDPVSSRLSTVRLMGETGKTVQDIYQTLYYFSYFIILWSF